MNLEAKWPKNLFLKTDGEVNRQICTPKVSILRSAIYEATLFFKSLYQNYGFLGKGRPSKIKLLQSYQVLWIYWCEPNCIPNIIPWKGQDHLFRVQIWQWPLFFPLATRIAKVYETYETAKARLQIQPPVWQAYHWSRNIHV